MSVRLQQHRDLERTFEKLVRTVESQDTWALRGVWAAFERELLEHLEEEERDQLPSFAQQHPHEATAIVAEHEQIRASLLELGVQLDLHLLREESVKQFLDRLRTHAAREERLLYPWIGAKGDAPGLRL